MQVIWYLLNQTEWCLHYDHLPPIIYNYTSFYIFCYLIRLIYKEKENYLHSKYQIWQR